jgi:hypothetical protein
MVFNPRNRSVRRERAEAIDRVIAEVTSWPGVTMAPHPFDAVEFHLEGVEFGRLDRDGVVDVPFVRRIRNALVDRGDVTVDRSVPNSGWVTYQITGGGGARRALRLLRLSYLYRTLAGRDAGAPPEDLRLELESLDLPARVADLFDKLLSRLPERAETDA